MTAPDRYGLSIFFDESGKKDNHPQLMGAVCIPSGIYHHDSLKEWRDLVQQHRFHWTEYTGNSRTREAIIRLFELIRPIVPYIRINMMSYDIGRLSGHANQYHKPDKNELLIQRTIYSKFPERIIFGMLREYKRSSELCADIYVEKAHEYQSIGLHDMLMEQLNAHALYRGESFSVRSCSYREKQTEIGVEFTDLILGIVRTVLQNPKRTSKSHQVKCELIYELDRRHLLRGLLKRLTLFEWTGHSHLQERDIETSYNLFVSANYDAYAARLPAKRRLEVKSAFIEHFQ